MEVGNLNPLTPQNINLTEENLIYKKLVNDNLKEIFPYLTIRDIANISQTSKEGKERAITVVKDTSLQNIQNFVKFASRHLDEIEYRETLEKFSKVIEEYSNPDTKFSSVFAAIQYRSKLIDILTTVQPEDLENLEKRCIEDKMPSDFSLILYLVEPTKLLKEASQYPKLLKEASQYPNHFKKRDLVGDAVKSLAFGGCTDTAIKIVNDKSWNWSQEDQDYFIFQIKTGILDLINCPEPDWESAIEGAVRIPDPKLKTTILMNITTAAIQRKETSFAFKAAYKIPTKALDKFTAWDNFLNLITIWSGSNDKVQKNEIKKVCIEIIKESEDKTSYLRQFLRISDKLSKISDYEWAIEIADTLPEKSEDRKKVFQAILKSAINNLNVDIVLQLSQRPKEFDEKIPLHQFCLDVIYKRNADEGEYYKQIIKLTDGMGKKEKDDVLKLLFFRLVEDGVGDEVLKEIALLIPNDKDVLGYQESE